jgi:hypothetical protein
MPSRKGEEKKIRISTLNLLLPKLKVAKKIM